ncbi:MAG: phosphoglucomutase/phosphomannomutase family protein [Ignavibacteria bacterium]|jgi:phosphomannomutase
MAIKFGTDGWRAVIADEYTFENVKKISAATAKAFRDHPKLSKGIIIGYDTRFLSKEFAECSAVVFAANGIKVYLTDSFVTTPTVSLITRDKDLAYGVMITSSHNPAKYNGYKLKDEYGGSMGTDLLKNVEKALNNVDKLSLEAGSLDSFLQEGKIEYINGKEYYIKNLKEKININSITSSGVKIIYDAMYGSGQGMMDSLVNITALRSEINPSFAGTSPEPVEKNLSLIETEMKRGHYDIGIVTDGDADRIAILNEKGEFINPQETFALLLTYLIENKKMTGGVVRGFSSSQLIEKICEVNNLKLYTVPIGFKYISELMVKEDILIGAEESGGIGLKNHLPERDGIFNGLLFCEMLSLRQKKLSDLIKDIESKYGKYFYKRIDKQLRDNSMKNIIMEKAKKIDDVAGMKVVKKDNLDGCKLFFENGWLLMRPSGTEPLLRLYTETYNIDKTDMILGEILKKLSLNNK